MHMRLSFNPQTGGFYTVKKEYGNLMDFITEHVKELHLKKSCPGHPFAYVFVNAEDRIVDATRICESLYEEDAKIQYENMNG